MSSSEGSPIKSPETPAVPEDSLVLASEQASTETSPKQIPTSRSVLKRKAIAKQSPASKTGEDASSKRAKTVVAPSPKLEKFLKRGVVRGKIVKVAISENKGLRCSWISSGLRGGWSYLQTPG